MRRQQVRRHADRRRLVFLGVNDEAAMQRVGRAFRLRQLASAPAVQDSTVARVARRVRAIFIMRAACSLIVSFMSHL
jgi:hypothetical protein